jgi:hypothetical protein
VGCTNTTALRPPATALRSTSSHTIENRESPVYTPSQLVKTLTPTAPNPIAYPTSLTLSSTYGSAVTPNQLNRRGQSRHTSATNSFSSRASATVFLLLSPASCSNCPGAAKALAWGVLMLRMLFLMPCEAMKWRCEDTSQLGVARPAAERSRARNQDGMGCVWVSILVAEVKSGRAMVGLSWERDLIEARASW